jgi:hypothetical protein
MDVQDEVRIAQPRQQRVELGKVLVRMDQEDLFHASSIGPPARAKN